MHRVPRNRIVCSCVLCLCLRFCSAKPMVNSSVVTTEPQASANQPEHMYPTSTCKKRCRFNYTSRRGLCVLSGYVPAEGATTLRCSDKMTMVEVNTDSNTSLAISKVIP